MKAKISGLGMWLPNRVRNNTDWPTTQSSDSENRVLIDVDLKEFSVGDRIALGHFAKEAGDRFLGTTRRRVADPEMSSAEAEARAASNAINDAGLDPLDIDVVMSWALVPDRLMPSNASKVIDIIQAQEAYGISVDAACASPVLHLELAASLIESGRAQHVLLTQSHLATKTFPLSHPASPNVGDAASAMVVSASKRQGIFGTVSKTHGDHYTSVTWQRGRHDDPPWYESGGPYYMGSKEKEKAGSLVRSTVSIAASTISELMTKCNVKTEDITLLASVQPRRWIPDAIVEALGAKWKAPQTFDELAHLGGCGPVINLIHARADGMLKSNDNFVMYAQGAGFIRCATLLRWI